MKINYHLHTSYSGDLRRKNIFGETFERYIKAAERLNFDEICFTDHLVVGYSPALSPYTHGMEVEKLDEYVHNVLSLAKSYSRPKIRLGIEVDWLPEKIGEIKAPPKQYPFDVILGSVHVLNGTDVERGDERTEFWGKLSDKQIHARYEAYYKELQNMIKSGICDIVAHFDMINRDAYLPKRDIWPLIKETLEIAAENNLTIEVNTRGMKKPINQIQPGLEILKFARKNGIPATIGTDAHKMEELDFYYEDAIKLLKEAGYKELAVFEKRKRKLVRI